MAHFSRTADALTTDGMLAVESIDCVDEHTCYVMTHTDVRWPADESASIALCDP